MVILDMLQKDWEGTVMSLGVMQAIAMHTHTGQPSRALAASSMGSPQP